MAFKKEKDPLEWLHVLNEVELRDVFDAVRIQQKQYDLTNSQVINLFCESELELDFPQILEFSDLQPEAFCSWVLKKHHSIFKFIRRPSRTLCFQATALDSTALLFIKDQDEMLCLHAMQNGGEIKYVHNQTKQCCLEAIKHCPSALQQIRKQTPEICLAAVQKWPGAFLYVREQTPEICMAAVAARLDPYYRPLYREDHISIGALIDEIKDPQTKHFAQVKAAGGGVTYGVGKSGDAFSTSTLYYIT